MCEICNDRRYLICDRDDGTQAVERCDACQSDRLSDEDAALIARVAGVDCELSYPCRVKS